MECVFQFLGHPRKHRESTPLVSYTSIFAWGPALAADCSLYAIHCIHCTRRLQPCHWRSSRDPTMHLTGWASRPLLARAPQTRSHCRTLPPPAGSGPLSFLGAHLPSTTTAAAGPTWEDTPSSQAAPVWCQVCPWARGCHGPSSCSSASRGSLPTIPCPGCWGHCSQI